MTSGACLDKWTFKTNFEPSLYEMDADANSGWFDVGTLN
jgi:hypothetical protein